MKNQNWEGKEEQEREAKQKKEEQDAQKKKDNAGGDSKQDDASKDAQSKGQNSNAKHDENGDAKLSEKKDNDSTKSKDDKKGGLHATDQKTNREPDPGAEHGNSTDDMTPAQKRFMDELIAEANAVNSFKNATGEPKDVTDPDGLGQVGYEIQVDDQFTPDVSRATTSLILPTRYLAALNNLRSGLSVVHP